MKSKKLLSQIPEIGEDQIKLLEKLSNAVSVSGEESEVRAIVMEEIKDFADDVKVDSLGNVLVMCRSKVKNPIKVMVAAHMDEVGFMLVDDEGEGLFRFEIIGGIDNRQLVGKPVLVGKEKLPGVIGAKPIHLTTAEERKNPIPLENLRIDVGPGNSKKSKVGDRATFATRFETWGPSLVGKALDDRLGVATLIELIKHNPENIELLAAFTVQEENGLRGARVAAYSMNPDIAFVLDSTPANDLPVWDDEENSRYNVKLNHGPAIYRLDASTLSDPRLINLLAETGDQYGIPYQYRQPGKGGTDAGAIHKQRGGIPSVSISVPGRYAHTAILIARRDDWKNTLALIYATLCNVTKEIFSTER
jgi:putative aminopeptidase FrvX